MKRCFWYFVIGFILCACTKTPLSTPIPTISNIVIPSSQPTKNYAQTSTPLASNTPHPSATNTPTPSTTPTPSLTPTSTIVPPKIHSKNESIVKNLDLVFPINTKLIFLPKSYPMLIGSNVWYTSTKEKLEENIKSMVWKFNIDGIDIPLESMVRMDKTGQIRGGTHPGVSFYSKIDEWSPGVHNATSGWTLENQMNDGFSDYPAGLTKYITESKIIVYNGDVNEKDFQKWPIVYKEDFFDESSIFEPGELSYLNNRIPYSIQNGELVFSSENIDSTYSGYLPFAFIGSDKYYISADIYLSDVTSGANYCFGYAFNAKKDFDSSFPYYRFSLCNLTGKQYFTVSEFSPTKKATNLLKKQYSFSETKPCNLGILVNGKHATFYIDNKKVYEVDLVRITPGKTLGFAYSFYQGTSMKHIVDNIQLSMPVDMSGFEQDYLK